MNIAARVIGGQMRVFALIKISALDSDAGAVFEKWCLDGLFTNP